MLNELTNSVNKVASKIQKALWIIIMISIFIILGFYPENSFLMGAVLLALWLSEVELTGFVFHKNKATAFSFVIFSYISVVATLILRSGLSMMGIIHSQDISSILVNFIFLWAITATSIFAVYKIYKTSEKKK